MNASWAVAPQWRDRSPAKSAKLQAAASALYGVVSGSGALLGSSLGRESLESQFCNDDMVAGMANSKKYARYNEIE